MLIKTDNGLRGATPADHDAWGKFRRRLEVMKPGSWMRFEWSTPRHGKHHRKFMALLNLITENSETYTTIEKALVAVKLVVGHFDMMTDPKTGEIIQVPRSIAYDAMGQEDFDLFYKSAVDGVLQHILPQLDHEKADELLEMIMLGWAN